MSSTRYKSASNKLKHGIDFVEAQALWQSRRVEVQAKIEGGQMRYVAIGEIKSVLYSVVISYLGATIRIVSTRKANPTEETIYAQQIKKSS